LSQHEGILRRLPVIDRHPAARHPEPASALRARRAGSPADVMEANGG
ncbi:hypothetical protein chiPu_0030240, partial [Chiloscyllium punctatum]|nr:hypothetical protein [Chiloscyllium punctatum]